MIRLQVWDNNILLDEDVGDYNASDANVCVLEKVVTDALRERFRVYWDPFRSKKQMYDCTTWLKFPSCSLSVYYDPCTWEMKNLCDIDDIEMLTMITAMNISCDQANNCSASVRQLSAL